MILWFENLGASDTAMVGGKAANLGECVRAGLPVPRGFAVGTDAYLQATKPIEAEVARLAQRGEAEAARALVLSADLPEEIRNRIAAAYEQLGAPPVAVRSSATAEDLADASFAGQQDTYLNVQGVDELLTAVCRCWASLWSDRAVAYRSEQGVATAGLALAVVVQEMVAPDVSGVLFTRNPVTGDGSKILVSASYGLGESVVSALVTPDTFEIARGSRTVTQREIGTKETRIDAAPPGGSGTTSDPGTPSDPVSTAGAIGTSGTVTTEVSHADRERPCLTDAQLLQLLELGDRVEKHYGSGQDIEWAFVGEELYLLQVRPITTAVATVAGHEPVRGRFATFLRDDFIEHFPGPYPLDLVSVHSLISGAAAAFGLVSVDPAGLVQGDDDGVIRLTLADFNPAGGFVRNLPRTLRTAFRHDPFAWPVEERDLRRTLRAMARTAENVRALSDAEVIRLMMDAVDQMGAITRDRFLNYLVPMMTRRNNAIALIALARLSKVVTTEDLYAGVPYKTAEIMEAITALADRARELNVAGSITSAPQGEVAAALECSPEGREFLTAASEFLAAFGARTTRLYLPFSNRSWREDPEMFYALLAAALRGEKGKRSSHSGDVTPGASVNKKPTQSSPDSGEGVTPEAALHGGANTDRRVHRGLHRRHRSSRAHQSAPDSAHSPESENAALRVQLRLPRILRRFWQKNTAHIRAMHIGREGTVYLIEEFLCVARSASDEIARRLVERGQLVHSDDLKFLYIEEVIAALEGASTPVDENRMVDASTPIRSSTSSDERRSRDSEGSVVPNTQIVSEGTVRTAETAAVPDAEARPELQRIVARRRRHRGLAESVWWDQDDSSSSHLPNGTQRATFTGSPASAGIAHGPARIVRSPADFHLLKPGDILVCPYTDPTWTPLFSLAAAVVAETGGPLSHAAIVAREYGIPAVLGVAGATNLQSGTELAVDGGKGTVSVRDW
ncbi:MAG: PEP/pyruvate-binding domain-containing protein [Ancrocorticia sp.]